MGNIRHWYAGTEYYINEFCIKTDEQGSGLGTYFLDKENIATEKYFSNLTEEYDSEH